ncbi:hypothetical protein AB3Z07_10930 [Metabacillus halosaccharovorans]|uniref:hypothetical protein n=1 Tax=Metabacillus halosaccharovorans TaxID=930124 RepID=UPI00203E4785|nr:hypothetical protein [Metabacillus halosaccharovorans]MCM3440990.1 hypothetical protein [Metabacillus halosaccharovorans]
MKDNNESTTQKYKIKQYSTIGTNGINITCFFTDNPEDVRMSREIFKDLIIKEIMR